MKTAIRHYFIISGLATLSLGSPAAIFREGKRQMAGDHPQVTRVEKEKEIISPLTARELPAFHA
jgi:hypothetical protein